MLSINLCCACCSESFVWLWSNGCGSNGVGRCQLNDCTSSTPLRGDLQGRLKVSPLLIATLYFREKVIGFHSTYVNSVLLSVVLIAGGC